MKPVVVMLCVILAGIAVQARAVAGLPQAPAENKAAAGPALNLNTATAAQLEKLPGVGPRTAARIVEYRQKNGGFKKVEELMNVRGMGEKGFLRIKNQLTVAPVKPDAP